ncbi:hypothetical protein QQP08_005829 [Theobroma cacao]|nr:hypothetical protein QQP08_005829 [Theobroma cacao]
MQSPNTHANHLALNSIQLGRQGTPYRNDDFQKKHKLLVFYTNGKQGSFSQEQEDTAFGTTPPR